MNTEISEGRPEEVCGTPNAGISINDARYVFPEKREEYHSRYPPVRLSVTTGHSRDLYRRMRDGTRDVAILRGDYDGDGIRSFLSQEAICLICSPEHESVPLPEYTYISHRTDSAQSAMMARWMNERGLGSLRNTFCVDNLSTCVEMVRRGLGWGLLPEIAPGDHDGCIRPCSSLNGEPLVRRTCLFCQKETADLPQVRTFMEPIRAER